MQPGLREFIQQLQAHDDLVVIEKRVDPRDISALITSSTKAVLLKNVDEYEYPVIGGIARDADKVALALGCKPSEVAGKLLDATQHLIPTVTVTDAQHPYSLTRWEVYIDGVLDEKLSAFVRNNTIVLDGKQGLYLFVK